MLKSNYQKPTKSKRTYLLNGIIKCKKCKGKMTGKTYKNKNGKDYKYYICQNFIDKSKVVCSGVTLNANNIEDFIISKLFSLSENKTFLNDKEKMIDIFKNKSDLNKYQEDIKRYESEEKKTNRKLDLFLDKFENGLIEDEDYKPRYDKLKNELSNIKLQKDKIAYIINDTDSIYNNYLTSFEKLLSFNENWEHLNNEGKKLRIQSIVKKIIADKENIDIELYMDFNNVYRPHMRLSRAKN